MVPLRFVKIPPQGTEKKWTRQEKKYEEKKWEKLLKKLTQYSACHCWKHFQIYATFKILCLLQENKVLNLKNVLLDDKKILRKIMILSVFSVAESDSYSLIYLTFKKMKSTVLFPSNLTNIKHYC